MWEGYPRPTPRPVKQSNLTRSWDNVVCKNIANSKDTRGYFVM